VTRQEEGRFFVREAGRMAATQLFHRAAGRRNDRSGLCARFSARRAGDLQDGFVALTSNIFGILGLRSLYLRSTE